MHNVLALDRSGRPSRWCDGEEAVGYVVRGLVTWCLGDTVTYRGGTNRVGQLSFIDVPNIIAIQNEVCVDAVPLTNQALFFRDGFTCCYCNQKFKPADLTREHIIPVSRGGPDSWMNCATACKRCNGAKGNKLLNDCPFELQYVPYVPSRTEWLMATRRPMQLDQLNFLMDAVPRKSPLRSRVDHPIFDRLQAA